MYVIDFMHITSTNPKFFPVAGHFFFYCAKNTYFNFWVVMEWFAFLQAHLAAACMVRVWSVFCGAPTGRMGFRRLDTGAVCWVGFMLTDARSSWRGLLMTCTSLEQHGDCCDWQRGEGGTTPKYLTEPLWLRADRWKQLEQDREMREGRGKVRLDTERG